ncbi:MAG: DNA recombination protein RmuC [Verrucomicrobiia bacterium]|jgi:DNA recombination protein RmuC
MNNIITIIAFIIGGAIGFIIAKVLLKSRYESQISVFNEKLTSKEERLLELQSQNQQLQSRVNELLADIQQESRARAGAEERCSRIPQLEAELENYKNQIEVYHQEIIKLQKRGSELETELQKERQAMEEKLGLLNEAREKLADAFKALSAEALRNNNQEFLQLARTKLETFQKEAQSELEKRKQAVEELIRPVKETLERFDNQVQLMEKERISAYEGLKTQVEQLIKTQDSLRSETANLVKALSAPKIRGRWGEIQLRRVVELAGMLEHCDFDEQVSVKTDDGLQRPDMIIHLPAGKEIVVDAKAPLAAYLNAIAATDEKERKEHLKLHAQQIRNHLDSLSRKSYWQQFKTTPEFVVLFLPGETFFSAALEEDPSLIEYGVEQKIIIATPTTLIALLRAVAYGWRQEALAVNAEKISQLGCELYKRLCTLGEHIHNIGTALDKAVDNYNKAVASLESRVFSQARKFKELESTNNQDELPELQQIEIKPRKPDVAELNGNDEINT